MNKISNYPNISSNPTKGEYIMRAEVIKNTEDGPIYGNINYYKVHMGWLDMINDNVRDDFIKCYTYNFYPSFIRKSIKRNGQNVTINTSVNLKDQLINFLKAEFDGVQLYDIDNNKCFSFMRDDDTYNNFLSHDILRPEEALNNSLKETAENSNKMNNYINSLKKNI